MIIKLVSLDGGPKNIDDDFDCSHNFIERLTGGPITVKVIIFVMEINLVI